MDKKIKFEKFEKGQIYKTDNSFLPNFYVRVLEDSDSEDSNFECVIIYLEQGVNYRYKVGETFKPLKKQYIFGKLCTLFKLTPLQSDDEVLKEEKYKSERKKFTNLCKPESIVPKSSRARS